MKQNEIRQQIITDLHNRYATKKYKKGSRHLDPADWKTILEAGRLSPSSFGYEPWKFVLLDKQARHDIAPFSWGVRRSIEGDDKIIAILARTDVSYNSSYVQHMVRDIKHRFYSPVSAQSQHFKHFQENDLGIENEKDRFNWASRQTYIALGNMLTTAARLGIDSCPLEGFNYEKMNEYLIRRGVMDPKHWRVSVLASFGHRDQPIRPKKRQPLSEIYTEM